MFVCDERRKWPRDFVLMMACVRFTTRGRNDARGLPQRRKKDLVDETKCNNKMRTSEYIRERSL